jgi:hypothetical protein
MGMKYALLNRILDELIRGRIKITVGKKGEIVSLISGWD